MRAGQVFFDKVPDKLDFCLQREWAKQFTGDGEWDGENHRLFESFVVAVRPHFRFTFLYD